MVLEQEENLTAWDRGRALVVYPHWGPKMKTKEVAKRFTPLRLDQARGRWEASFAKFADTRHRLTVTYVLEGSIFFVWQKLLKVGLFANPQVCDEAVKPVAQHCSE